MDSIIKIAMFLNILASITLVGLGSCYVYGALVKLRRKAKGASCQE